MGVITKDPAPWVCHEYNFQFLYNGMIYYLSSHGNLIDPYHQHRNHGERTVLSNVYGEIYVLPYFMPISTGDDMHEEAWDLFHRLRKMVIFS